MRFEPVKTRVVSQIAAPSTIPMEESSAHSVRCLCFDVRRGRLCPIITSPELRIFNPFYGIHVCLMASSKTMPFPWRRKGVPSSVDAVGKGSVALRHSLTYVFSIIFSI